jgi:hypothetical protein
MKCSFCLLEKMTYSHVFKNVTFQTKRNAQVKIKSVMYLLSKDPHRIFDFLLPRVKEILNLSRKNNKDTILIPNPTRLRIHHGV